MTVWLIYCADHLLDAAKMDPSIQATYRHQFHRRHRVGLTVTWMILLIVDACVACLGLDGQIQMLGIGLSAGVLVYGAGTHFAATPLRRIPKELQVGLLFALGVSLTSWSSVLSLPTEQRSMLLTIALASMLFSLNCIFVAQCELESDLAQGFDSFPRRWIDFNHLWVGRILIVLMIGLAVASLVLASFAMIPWIAGAALAISFVFLSAASLARATHSIAIDRGFGKSFPAGFIADSALFLPPLLCFPWLN